MRRRNKERRKDGRQGRGKRCRDRASKEVQKNGIKKEKERNKMGGRKGDKMDKRTEGTRRSEKEYIVPRMEEEVGSGTGVCLSMETN